MKKALVIGIDNYPQQPLKGCVNDALAIASTLEKNGDGSPNFSVQLLTNEKASNAAISDSLCNLFKGDADVALLYFAGHGIISPDTNTGHIVSIDGGSGAWGMSIADILGKSNQAYPHIKSTVVILDCCHSGFMGEVPALSNSQIATIGTGVTILTACHRNAVAAETNGHGLFTSILLDALSGSAADICGRITPASLYSHVDQILGPWEQRPIYKANVQTFVVLREVSPKIPKEVLRRLPDYFPEAAHTFPLDPSFESDRNSIPEKFRHLPRDESKERQFKELQMYNRHGLVVPTQAEHMYYAAIEATGCRLTAFGAHYLQLAKLNRI
ncbi:MAG TPA: caspase family protein [Gammaproteobacteria bacterium]|nr:caspase family protein [Gammaproteobacteria bacterium]